jgi:hypothetical protein
MATSANDKLRDKLTKLFALLGSNNAGEREAARRKIDELLAKNKETWNDLTELLSTGNAQGWQNDEPDTDTGGGGADRRPAPLDLIRYILQRHLHLTEHQLVAVTLWVAHTFLHSRFAITPRLALESPVRGCGKTTLLNIIKTLAFKTSKSDHLTAAVLFRLIERDRPTLLLDEADNQDLPNDPTLRAVINSGHHCDGRSCAASGTSESSRRSRRWRSPPSANCPFRSCTAASSSTWSGARSRKRWRGSTRRQSWTRRRIA